jgi:transposase
MTGTRGPWNEATELRAIELVSSLKSNIRPDGRVSFRVSSSDGTKEYIVAVDPDGWTCSCSDWTDRRKPCKHVVATVRWLDPNPPPILDEEVGRRSPTYGQASWPKYDRAQQLEHEVFDALLWDLLGAVPEVVSKVGRRGRKSIPLRTQILMAVRKVHLNQSSRRARGLLVALNQDGKGILPRVPNYSIPSRFFNKEFATPILLGLIELSGSVLRELETNEAVAIDSSGFSTSTMGAYFTEKYDPARRHRFVKAHLAVGVKSHVVISAKITDERGADCPQFDPLLRRLHDLGRFPGAVVADKAYLSRANLDLAESLGADPYIPFKVNSRALAKGSPMWNRKYYEFMLHRDEFDEIYHQRSNVESTFSAIKRKLGEPLLSKTELARLNELLGKILAYNVSVVIKHATLLSIDPGPLGVKARDLAKRTRDDGVAA